MTAYRQMAMTPQIQITPRLMHLYLQMDPAPHATSEIELWIKRADGSTLSFHCAAPCCGAQRHTTARCGCAGRDSRWLLRYPAHDYQDGSIGFRFDDHIHRLPPGLYAAELRRCGIPFHRFDMRVSAVPVMGAAAETRDSIGECGPADGGRDDVDPVFSLWHNYKTQTTQEISPTDVLLRVALPVRGTPAEPYPELVISDGVVEEAMQVTFSNGTTLGVKRTGTNRFFDGACVRFMWTDANLEAAGYKNPNLILCEDIFCCGTMPCDGECP